ncbi:MAG: hypothetical protein RL518_1410 [Pseudomonadota bacterium]
MVDPTKSPSVLYPEVREPGTRSPPRKANGLFSSFYPQDSDFLMP